MKIPTPLKGLLLSRKVWVAVIVATGSGILYAQGAITADELADVFVKLALAVIISIAGEDMAQKYGQGKATEAAMQPGPMMVGGDATTTIIHEATEAAPVEAAEAVEAVRVSAVPESAAGGGG